MERIRAVRLVDYSFVARPLQEAALELISYTTIGKPGQTSVTIPEAEQTLVGTYTTYASYNPDGSAQGLTLPAVSDLPTEDLTWEYDDLGNPVKMSGGPAGAGTVTYADNTEYTRYGELARVQLGQIGKRLWLSYYYEDSTRRLARTIVDAEAPRPMQADVRYAYTPSGMITSVANAPQESPADVQCFRFDHLQRLTEAWTPGGDCAADPSTAALAGPAPYWHSYRYDKVGNRLGEVQHAAAGDTTRAYAYPEAGAAQPHTLRSVTTARSEATTLDEYAYDAIGNTTQRPEQTLDWDVESRLAKVTEGGKVTEFVYDADGNRLIRRDPTGRTLYLDGQELRLEAGSGKKVGTRYYKHAGAIVAMRTASGLRWLAGDHQGTARISVDSEVQQVTQRRQTPFGGVRGPAVNWPGEKGFVGGTIDASTGLTHLGAREYDPTIGRFISVDPLMDLADPQQMHGYSYADNSPISKSDPTGLIPTQCPDGECRGGPYGNSPGPATTHPGVSPAPAWTSPRLCPDGDCPNNGKAAPKTQTCAYGTAPCTGPHPKRVTNQFQNICATTVNCDGKVQNWLYQHANQDFLDVLAGYAAEAGVDPQLLLAILITESGDCHCGQKGDLELAIAGELGLHTGSIGLANMQQTAFDKAVEQSGGKISYPWIMTGGTDYDDNVHRSVQSVAHYLKYLDDKLEGQNKSPNPTMTRAEIIRVGYNFGAGVDGGYDWMGHVAALPRRPTGDPDLVLAEFHLAWYVSGNMLCSAGHVGC